MEGDPSWWWCAGLPHWVIQTLVTTTTTCLISIDHVAPPHQQLYQIGLLFLLYSACEWAKLIHCGGSCNVTISCALSMFLSKRCFGGARGRHSVISPTVFDYYLFANKGDNIHFKGAPEQDVLDRKGTPTCLPGTSWIHASASPKNGGFPRFWSEGKHKNNHPQC